MSLFTIIKALFNLQSTGLTYAQVGEYLLSVHHLEQELRTIQHTSTTAPRYLAATHYRTMCWAIQDAAFIRDRVSVIRAYMVLDYDYAPMWQARKDLAILRAQFNLMCAA